MKKAVTYAEALRWLNKRAAALLDDQELHDVDAIASLEEAGFVAELFSEDLGIVATDAVRERLSPGSVS